jgi:hypothetical protein
MYDGYAAPASAVIRFETRLVCVLLLSETEMQRRFTIEGNIFRTKSAERPSAAALS